jgi:hypothetical protein
MSRNFRYIINIILYYCLKSNHSDIIYIDLPFPYNQYNPIDTVYKSNFINNNQKYKGIVFHLKYNLPDIDYNYCWYNIFNNLNHIIDTKDSRLDNIQSNKNYNSMNFYIKNNINYKFNIINQLPIKNIHLNN